jgi:hypothetical protein
MDYRRSHQDRQGEQVTAIRVYVTQDDIDNGEPHNPCGCPIARAITRVRDTPTVFSSWAYIGGTCHTEYDLPPEATEFIRRFDIGEPVEPFDFEMTEVDQ